jgi:hypothetical protein
MTTISREATSSLVALPESPPETLEGPGNDFPQINPSWRDALDALDANDLDAVAAMIHARAERQRVQVTYDEAEAKIDATWLTDAAELSPYKEIIRVATCLRREIERGVHPETLRDSYLLLAYERAPHPRIALMAISEGTRKGLAARAARAAANE